MNARLTSAEAAASQRTRAVRSSRVNSRRRSVGRCGSHSGSRVSTATARMSPGAISHGVTSAPNRDTRYRTTTGPTAKPAMPPVVNRPTANPGLGEEGLPTMLVATGCRAAEPMPPTTSSSSVTATLPATAMRLSATAATAMPAAATRRIPIRSATAPSAGWVSEELTLNAATSSASVAVPAPRRTCRVGSSAPRMAVNASLAACATASRTAMAAPVTNPGRRTTCGMRCPSSIARPGAFPTA